MAGNVRFGAIFGVFAAGPRAPLHRVEKVGGMGGVPGRERTVAVLARKSETLGWVAALSR